MQSTARKTSTVPTKVITIGGSAPRLQKVLSDENFAARLYHTNLVKIENVRRARLQTLYRILSPRLGTLEGQRDALELDVQNLRKGLRPKSERQTPEQVDRLEKIELLKKQKKTICLEIPLERKAVVASHITAAREKQRARRKELGLESMGPNSRMRQEAMAALRDELRCSDLPRGGKIALLIDERANASARRARSLASAGDPERGIVKCSTGTYLAVEGAVAQARKTTLGLLKLHRWDGCGRIGVQFTQSKGLTTLEALSGQNPRLKIEVANEGRLRKSKSDTFHPSHSRKVDIHAEARRKRAERFAREPELRPCRRAVTVRLKLSGRVKDAHYVDFTGVLHRPLPEDGVIKWAFLNIRRIGYEYRVDLQLSIESQSFAVRRKGVGSGKRLAINLGWRRMRDGVRVATTFDGTNIGHIVLKRDLLESHRHGELLLAHADDKFNEAIITVREWINNLSVSEAERLLPVLREAMPYRCRLDSLPQIVANMTRWRGHNRLRRVVELIQQHELYLDRESRRRLWADWSAACIPRKKHPAERDLYASLDELTPWLRERGVRSVNTRLAFYLEVWRRKEEHLTNNARHVVTKLQRRKLDIYRKLAFHLDDEFEVVAIEQWDKSETARTPKYEEDSRSPQEENASSVRQFAGISHFTRALGEKFGDNLIKVDAGEISAVHFACGGTAVTTLDESKPGLSATPLLHCGKCGRAFDQDANGARHLWHRAFGGEGSDAPENPDGARESEIDSDHADDLDSAAQ